MLAVAADADAVQPYLDGEVTLAAANSAQACVVAGTPAAIARLVEHLTAQGVPCQRLHTSHAFHSPLMDAVVAPFQARVQQCRLQPPQLPFLSNQSGTWITPAQATDPAYWAQHLRQPVQFAANLTTVLADPTRVLLEVGPGQSLSTLARQHAGAGNVVAVACLPTAQEQVGAETRMLQSVGRLWTAGVTVDWAAFHAAAPRRVPLPTYPFERRRFWIEPGPRTAAPAPVAATTRRANIADWFYAPLWKQSLRPEPVEADFLAEQERSWVILADGDGVGAALAERLRAVGQTVVLVQSGRTWQPLSAEQFVLNADHPADYDALVAALPAAAPLHVIHCWSLMPPDTTAAPDALPLGFRSLLYLAQALGRRSPATPQQLTVLSRHLYPVTGSEPLEPLTALLLGLCTVLPQEYPQLTCRHLDLDTLPLQPLRPALLDALLSELVQPGSEPRVAYRGHQRWLPTYEPTPLPPAPARPKRLRPGGVYLITGGVGGIGLTLAAYLARTVQAKLVLTSRSALLPADTTAAADDPRHAQVAALTALGAEVLVLSADVTDRAAMADVVATTLARFGALHGVIHAAGVAGGGLIQGQTAASVAAVLAPKVTGTQVVHAVTQELALDFLVLCSSLTALTGGLGQMAYCAANAFLDAFAQQHAQARQTTVVALNWDRWQGVGMAVAAAAALGLPVETGTPVHPLLGTCVLATPTQVAYRAELSPASHWVLAEHQVAGTPTLPGTAYLEMARAALAHFAPDRPCELRDVVFVTPLSIKEHETRNVLITLEKNKNNDIYDFHVVSQAALDQDTKSVWQKHVMGKISYVSEMLPQQHDLAAKIAGYQQLDVAVSKGESQNKAAQFIEMGPRWQALQQVYLGRNEGLALLELPAAFTGDLENFKLHPSLLDVAAGCLRLVSKGNYLPLAYERLRINSPLPATIYTYVSQRNHADPDKEIITGDIIITDTQGTELVAINGFTMKKIAGSIVARQKDFADGNHQAALAVEPHLAEFYDTLITHQAESQEAGIFPDEGVEAFSRLLDRLMWPQIVVSTRELSTVMERAANSTVPRILEALKKPETYASRHSRPDMNSPYVPPDNEMERTIAEVWQRVLGIEHVGIHDNFFELGGTSLVGLQLVAELKQVLGIDVPIVSIFEAPTIHELAKRLSSGQSQHNTLERRQARANKQNEVIEQQKRLRRRQ
jgi:acyl transferase domain-containing protein/acyl carrier protein